MSIVYCTLLQFTTFGCPGNDFGKVGNYMSIITLHMLATTNDTYYNMEFQLVVHTSHMYMYKGDITSITTSITSITSIIIITIVLS